MHSRNHEFKDEHLPITTNKNGTKVNIKIPYSNGRRERRLFKYITFMFYHWTSSMYVIIKPPSHTSMQLISNTIEVKYCQPWTFFCAKIGICIFHFFSFLKELKQRKVIMMSTSTYVSLTVKTEIGLLSCARADIYIDWPALMANIWQDFISHLAMWISVERCALSYLLPLSSRRSFANV